MLARESPLPRATNKTFTSRHYFKCILNIRTTKHAVLHLLHIRFKSTRFAFSPELMFGSDDT